MDVRARLLAASSSFLKVWKEGREGRITVQMLLHFIVDFGNRQLHNNIHDQ